MSGRSAAAPRRVLAGAVGLLLAAGSLALTAPAARADSAPAAASATSPATVAGDGLPTVQVNGVVWSQVVVGNTVYAAGSFTRARPAGSPAGQNETVRNNLLAYDLTTGALVTSFAPDLNGQAMVVAASPDGSRIYVGGDFTRANGQVRNRVAAYDTASGQLVTTWAPSVNSQVRAIAATAGTVYLGGSISAVGGVSRSRLAAVRAADGGLLPWAPVPGIGSTAGNTDGSTATSNEVLSMVLTGGGSQVVVSGRFDSLNGVKATGVGALDAGTGATRPFAIGQQITNQGINSAIFSLSTDGTNVYGTAYNYYGPGNLEGTFAATAAGGTTAWVSDCLGDSYSSYATGGAVYIASHSHNCGTVGSFPEQNPRTHKFATALSVAPAGQGSGTRLYQGWWRGTAAPAMLPWYPALTSGTYTGQFQAGWSVTGTNRYVVYGGEFVKVNGVAQQGLVRFAVPSIAPNAQGPAADASLTPALTTLQAGTVRVAWQATSDVDNERLTYTVVRSDRPGVPVYQATADSTWWNRPAMGFVDRDVKAGATYTYRVTVTDPYGNAVSGAPASTTVPAAVPAPGAYAQTVLADGPAHYWRLGEAAGTGRSYDQVGVDDLELGSGVTQGSAGAVAGTTDGSATFDGTENGIGVNQTIAPSPDTFSAELWFSTRSTSGGVLLDYGSDTNGESQDHDRHVYLDNAGHLSFGVWPGWSAIITSSRTYNDGGWHHVVATVGRGGMAFYVDGQLIGSRADATGGESFTGYWRIGGDTRWAGDTDWFAGKLDDVAVYDGVLTAAQVQRHYTAGRTGTAANLAPRAAVATTASGLTATFDGTGSTDVDGSVASYAWTFGDGSTGTGARPSHTYARAGTYRATLTVTDDRGATGSTSTAVAVVTGGTAGSPYSRAVLDSGASSYWRLSEPSGAAIDLAGTDDLDAGTGVQRGTAGAISGDTDTAATFSGTSAGVAVMQRPAAAPNVFTVEAWFRTTSRSGGKLFGYGDARTGDSYNDDRHVYMDASGYLYFGVWPQEARILSSSRTYNDGRWHQVVASLGGSGMALYVDGQLIGSRTDTTAGQSYTGYWRVGGDTTWAGAKYFGGDIDDVSVYPTVLPSATVARHYALATTAVANSAPQAAFTATTAGLTATLDGRGSTDPDGSVRSWAWSFGDGTTATGATASHAYATAGTYQVTLTVTDDGGATATTQRSVTVTAPPPNQAPTASFTTTSSDLTASVDASASADPDGTLTGYAWTFGDGGTAAGRTAAHTYAAAGTYTVRLTVTDDDGATGTTTRTVTVSAPAGPAAIARDVFDRTVSNGWGTATTGGPWTASTGGTRQSVTPGVGEMRLDSANQNSGAYLGGVSQTAVDVQTTFTLSAAPTGNGTYVYVTGRRVGTAGEYRARVRVTPSGQVYLALSRLTGTTESFPGGEVLVPGVTWAPGTALDVHVRVTGTGTTQVLATVWAHGTDEPAAPSLTRTDTTAALQAAGAVGLAVHRPSGTTAATAVRFTSFTVTVAG